jgi:hypothetical protein
MQTGIILLQQLVGDGMESADPYPLRTGSHQADSLSFISRAALFVKVMAITSSGFTPFCSS